MSTPRDDGFAATPEWAPHARCWMAWPCRAAAGVGLEGLRRIYAEVAQAIVRFEPVTVIARPELVATASLQCGPGITVRPMPQDDGRIRDVGPSFLTDGRGALAGVAWKFNGWGELHPDHGQDAQLARRLLEHVGARCYDGPIVLEGGAVAVDGEGTCLAGAAVVLDPRRNPGLTREEAERALQQMLGVERVIWIPHGLADAEAGGQLASVVRFARPGTVLALATDDRSDANFDRLAENLDVLRAATDARSRQLEVITLAQPRPQKGRDGRRLVASHLDCCLVNGAVIVPGFGDATDGAACRMLAQVWPEREIVQIDALELAEAGIGLHAVTLPQPVT
ncbi:agmatine deiminase family protein [Benzoatithermus flavus]|uniref:Agmatine deiminase family protein n=1 Tax=Benzoatithermus flavus TaxID=3108223 RepID=A0ABU8XZY7_9PROT